MNRHRFYDVIVLGGGAAGLMAAATAGKRGRRVLLLERSNKIGKKILMSGGGRCNFTNLEISANNFICSNPHFVKSALSQYSQWDFIALVSRYGVAYHEKTSGQLFCDDSSKEILRVLQAECDAGKVEIRTEVETEQVNANDSEAGGKCRFSLATSAGRLDCESLIVATGGLSVPTLGGSGFGYQLAQQFGLGLTTREASLVPFTLTGALKDMAAQLSGVSLPVVVTVEKQRFAEAMLFTHRGLSGPAILQASNYWQLGQPIEIDLCPGADLQLEFVQRKQKSPTSSLSVALADRLPKSLAQTLVNSWWPEFHTRPIQEIKDKQLADIAVQLHRWRLTPSGTEGYRTAEVTRGGVDVSHISSKTMEVNYYPGLFITGEVLDVTGHLGGFNFQWAWSSGYVAGMEA